MPISSVPLLPGEAALAFLVTIQVLNRVQSSQSSRTISLFDWAIGLFIVIGSLRFIFGMGGDLFLEIRDFATVYYAAFFFLASNLAAHRGEVLRLVLQTIRISSLFMVPLYILSEAFPAVFFGPLSFRGVPLIHFKDDLVGAYCAIGAVAHYMHSEERRSPSSFIISIALAGSIVLTNNRAAMLGLAVAAGWMMTGQRWRFPFALGIVGLVGSIGLIVAAEARLQSWQDTPLLEFYERVVSVFDPTGQGQYHGAMTESKGDNNLFRTTWWTVAIEETIETNPVFGLGFGHDIAANFLREYYATAPDDFTARSPHSILVTVFARMGIVGFLVLLIIIGLFARRTWAYRFGDPQVFTAACAAWVILTSACFGVVLEGPMGAIPFWTLLGLAYGAALNPAAKSSSAPAPEALAPSP